MLNQKENLKDEKFTPLVSCLCVTENRPAFIPWLLWCYNRQNWQNRELIIIDSSPEPFIPGKQGNIRVLPAKPGTSVGQKRNTALQAAQGDIITWFDDDDWQHPNKILWLVEALSNGASYAGAWKSWFVDLFGSRCCVYKNGTNKYILFNSAGFKRNVARSTLFNENLRHGSDTRWLWDLTSRQKEKILYLNHDLMFFWLCHSQNLSNPTQKRKFDQDLETLKKIAGSEAWGDTDDQLEQLRTRLQEQSIEGKVIQRNRRTSFGPPLTKVMSSFKVKNDKTESMSVDKQPEVGIMIKATVMDVPYLDFMVRHMVSQARYPFKERIIIIDPQLAFQGKYQSRHKGKREDLDKILNQLLRDGIIDNIREVDASYNQIEKIKKQFFKEDVTNLPTHAVTGGPIYATLFGLASMSTDLVVQMDSDIFFYTSSESWVKEALRCMQEDARLWLMMTHPGPPAGPKGNSLGRFNKRIGTWDAKLSIWRFQTATTRYFLCDRRKLYNRLSLIQKRDGYAPLEECIGAALKRYNAYRGVLGNLNSWHLHAWYHDNPFPQLASSLGKSIEAGYYPSIQRGNYDLRLDQAEHFQEWNKILNRHEKHPDIVKKLDNNITNAIPESERKTKIPAAIDEALTESENKIRQVSLIKVTPPPTIPGDFVKNLVPLAIVIPVRDRAGQRLKNTMIGLNWQSIGVPGQIILVSYGSQPEVNKELSEICKDYNAKLIITGNPGAPWNKSFALNIGIRATLPELAFVMTMDIDMILAPNFFEIILPRLKRKPPAFVLCKSSDLPQNVSIPTDKITLVKEFDQLIRLSKLRPHWGTGGIQAAERSFFFSVRGYDEDLHWWGGMDGDMVNRARLAGIEIEWVENRTAILHQWHVKKHLMLADPEQKNQAQKAWIDNHLLINARSNMLVRNLVFWGGQA